jgi:hypothetical protein
MRPYKRTNILGLGVILWLVIVLSGCGLLLPGERGAGQAPARFGSVQAATIVPTITPRPTRTPTPQPTLQAPSAEDDGLFVVPATPGTLFTIEAADDEINEYLEGEVYEQDGSSIRDIRILFTDDEIIANGQGSYKPLNLEGGITARGVSIVSDGKVYLQVRDVALDSSLPAFTRFLAEVAIEQALRQYGTPLGIEIPIEDAEIYSIDLQPGKIVITGRTRELGAERGA